MNSRLIEFCFSCFFRLFLKKSQNIEKLLNRICDNLEGNDHYLFYRLKPKEINTIPTINSICELEDLAILLQGPVGDGCQVIKYINFYKSTYPKAHIIVSTWKDEESDTIRRIKNSDVIVVLNDKPEYSGILNVNYQIVSTLAGIKKAEEIGARVIAKTRTDQCICKRNVFNSLDSILDSFPVKPDDKLINRRIVVMPTYYGNMFTPYFMSDFFYYGDVADLKMMFEIDLDCRKPFSMGESDSRRRYAELEYPPEIFIMKHFLADKLGFKCDNTIRDYWDSLRKYYVCIDRNMLDLLTPKYNYRHMDHVCNSEYFLDDSIIQKKTLHFGFLEWMNLYSGKMKYKECYESEADNNMI